MKAGDWLDETARRLKLMQCDDKDGGSDADGGDKDDDEEEDEDEDGNGAILPRNVSREASTKDI